MVEAASAQHEIAVIRYLDEKPLRADLVMLATTLDGAPGDLVRRDPEFHEMRCDESTLEDIDVVVDLLVRHPTLLQRPLLTDGSRTIIGRPPSRIGEVLGV